MSSESPLVVGDPTRRVDGSWLASDGNWYPAHARPGNTATVAPVPAAAPPSDGAIAVDGQPPAAPPPQFPSGYEAGQYAAPPASVYTHNYAAPPAQQGGQGLAIASLVLGVGALLFSLLPLIGFLSVPFALGGFGCGVAGWMQANKGNPGKGLAIAGVVTSTLAIVVSVLWFTLFATVGTELDDINSDPVNGICNPDRFWEDPDC